MAYEWNEEFIIAFGKRLRQIRKSKGMTIEELAEKAGLTYSQVGRIERGKINTTIHTAFVLSQALGVEVSDLFEI